MRARRRRRSLGNLKLVSACLPRRSWLPIVRSASLTRLTIALVALFVAYAAIQGLTSNVTIIRVVSVPDSLAGKGINAEFLAQAIMDEIHFIRADARALNRWFNDPLQPTVQEFAPLYGTIATDPRPELQVSDAGPSLRQAVEFIQRTLGIEHPTLTLRVSEDREGYLLTYSVAHDGEVDGPYTLSSPDIMSGTGVAEPPLRLVAINLMSPSEPKTLGSWMASTGRYAQLLQLLASLSDDERNDVAPELLPIANGVRVGRGIVTPKEAVEHIEAITRTLRSPPSEGALSELHCELAFGELLRLAVDRKDAVDIEKHLLSDECSGPNSKLVDSRLYRAYVRFASELSRLKEREQYASLVEQFRLSAGPSGAEFAAYFRGLSGEGDWEDEFRKALELGYEPSSLHERWAHILWTQGDLHEALSHAQIALQDRGGFEESSALTYVRILREAFSESAAYEYLQHATSSHRHWVQGLYELGTSAEDLGLIQSAEDAYRRAISVNPGDHQTHLEYGWFLSRQGSKEASDEQFQLAIHLAPSHQEPYDQWGRALLYADHYEDASEKLLVAYERDPGSTAKNLKSLADSCAFGPGPHFEQERRAVVPEDEPGKLLLLVGACMGFKGHEAASWRYYRKAHTSLGRTGITQIAEMWAKTHPEVRRYGIDAWLALRHLAKMPATYDLLRAWMKLPGCDSDCAFGVQDIIDDAEQLYSHSPGK